MKRRAIAALAFILVAGGCSPDTAPASTNQDAARSFDGPLYAAADLRSRRILGVHLGMSVADARRELASRGYVHRYTNDSDLDGGGGHPSEWVDYFSEPSGGSITLSYVRSDGGPGLISALRRDRRLTEAEQREVEARRAEILEEHGHPSRWFRWTNEGRLGDSMAYVTSGSLRNDDLRGDVWSCYANWRCNTARGTNCRRILARVREPVLIISAIHGGVSYELDDYAARYDVLRRSRDFADARYRPQQCPVMPAH